MIRRYIGICVTPNNGVVHTRCSPKLCGEFELRTPLVDIFDGERNPRTVQLTQVRLNVIVVATRAKVQTCGSQRI